MYEGVSVPITNDHNEMKRNEVMREGERKKDIQVILSAVYMIGGIYAKI